MEIFRGGNNMKKLIETLHHIQAHEIDFHKAREMM